MYVTPWLILAIWKKLSLPELTPTRMTLELADRSITHPKGVTEEVFVKVGSFHFPTDFVVVDFEADPRVPLILGRSFFRTGCGLIDVYEGELILRDENEQIIFHVDGISKHPQKHVNESIKMVNDTCEDSFKRFTDEPALVFLPPPEDDNDEKEKQEVKNIAEPTAKRQTRITPCLKNFKDECFDPGGDNDEIDSFLAIEVSTNIEEGYYDSERDVFYLESLLSDDTTHNLSPKNDLLHHEFAGEIITNPSRIAKEHEEYISRMWLLCRNSSSRSLENFHASPNTIIESLPTFHISVQDSDSHREEIDIFPGPNDSIPPGIESDFDSEEEIIFLDNLLNDDISVPKYERFTIDIEPNVPMINNFDELNEDECFDPRGGEINVEVDDSFTFFRLFSRFSPTLWFLLYFSPPGMKTPFLTPASPLRTGGISSGWNFHVL
ncbi:reverse transcriptase domain-containing protein [Tanacetum coccineum]